jgi:predicted permease
LVKYFVHVNPIELPVGSDVSVNIPVLIFTALLTIATALIFGIAPAWSGSRGDVNDGLRAAGRGAIAGGNRRLTRVLIASEIALSLILLSGAGLLMRSVLKFGAANLGFDPDHVLVMNSRLPALQRYAGAPEKVRFYDDLEARLSALPGVEGATIAGNVPPYGAGSQEVEVAGRGRVGLMDQNAVGEDYFSVLHIALRRGRVFTHEDGPDSAPVAVVSEKFANQYFPGTDPIGRRVRGVGDKEEPWLTIVGVVATEKHPELMHEMSWHESAELYRPLRQQPAASFSIALRTQGKQADIGRAIEHTLAAVDPEVPVGEISTMRDTLGSYLKYPRFRAIVLDQFAGLALLLAALGLHGLLSQYVTQRTRELGLRMAIGAQTRDILRLIAIQGGMPVLIGAALGMVLTVMLTGYLSNLLFEVSPGDPWTLIVAPLVLLTAAVAATVKPALDAAAVDPMVALRDE